MKIEMDRIRLVLVKILRFVYIHSDTPAGVGRFDVEAAAWGVFCVLRSAAQERLKEPLGTN